MGSFQKFRLRWNNHSSNFVGNLGSLLESEEYSDVTVCCQGQVWHLHQLVLSASSGHFAHLLRLIPPGQTPILILDGPPASDVQALIHFIYHGEVNIDHDALPSLLRTASSFRIKGLSDINSTAEITGSDSSIACETFSPSVSVETLVHNNTEDHIFEDDVTPLNLSCNKKSALKEPFVVEKRSFKETSSNDFVSTNDCLEEGSYNPSPSKKIRILEPNFRRQEPATIALIAPNNGAIITPYVASKPANQFSKVAAIKSIPTSKENFQQRHHENIHPPEIKIEQSPKEIPEFMNLPSKTTFPILKMALSPQLAYQPSSTTSPNPEVMNPYREHQQIEMKGQKLNCISTPDNETQIYDDGCKRLALTDESSIICDQSPLDSHGAQPGKEYKIEFTDEENELPNHYMDNPQLEIPETTFTHKKFSVCTIPQSPTSIKPVHAVRGVFSSVTSGNSPSSDCYKNNDAKLPPSETTCVSTGSNNTTRPNSPDNPSASTLLTPNIVKLTPVSVTGFASIKYPANSIVYSASIDFPTSDSSVISSSCPASDPLSVPVAIQAVAVKGEEQTSPYLQSLFRQVGSNEVVENTPSTSQSPSVSTITTTGEGVNATPTAQRVTVNMRTFKEEWRRQLLVDYDPNTNMSICMLCFTTFKSYDGPRKNTYVKHAKRFHPALEEYSDEERGVIISMYEKYHKYDIDMQKEINKSFRTTNGTGAALKRLRAAESMQIPHHPVGISTLSSNQSDTDPESSDHKGDSAPESNLRDSVESSSSEPESLMKITGGSCHITAVSDKDFPNNNNSKNNRNKNEPQHSAEDPMES